MAKGLFQNIETNLGGRKQDNPNYHAERCKKWRNANPSKVRAAQKRNYEKKKEEHLIYARKHYYENQGKYKTYAANRRRGLKIKVINHYSNGSMECSCCGENIIEFLTIDHINGGGRKHLKQLGPGNFYTWLIKNNYPEGFRVLCLNCNFANGQLGYCPHQERENSEKYRLFNN